MNKCTKTAQWINAVKNSSFKPLFSVLDYTTDLTTLWWWSGAVPAALTFVQPQTHKHQPPNWVNPNQSIATKAMQSQQDNILSATLPIFMRKIYLHASEHLVHSYFQWSNIMLFNHQEQIKYCPPKHCTAFWIAAEQRSPWKHTHPQDYRACVSNACCANQAWQGWLHRLSKTGKTLCSRCTCCGILVGLPQPTKPPEARWDQQLAVFSLNSKKFCYSVH